MLPGQDLLVIDCRVFVHWRQPLLLVVLSLFEKLFLASFFLEYIRSPGRILEFVRMVQTRLLLFYDTYQHSVRMGSVHHI